MDTQDVLDHFVSGFDWSVPTRFQLVDTDADQRDAGLIKPLLAFAADFPAPRIHNGPGLLEDFLKLESASNKAILGYARRWGPLWLCGQHDLPYRHDPNCEPDYDKDLSDGEPEADELSGDELLRLTPAELIAKERWPSAWYVESLYGWRNLSRHMRATVRIARRLNDGQLASHADWEALRFLDKVLANLVVPRYEDTLNPAEAIERDVELERELQLGGLDPETLGNQQDDHVVVDDKALAVVDTYQRLAAAVGRLRLRDSLAFQRRALSQVLNEWLELGGVRPRLDWPAARPQVQLGGHGLIGALAVQLLFECSKTDGLAVCTSCGTPFLPGPRRPRRDRNVYCSDCGLHAATRDAAARYRQTEKYRATYQKWRKRRQPGQA